MSDFWSCRMRILDGRYIFFSSHRLVVAFHMPPAFVQFASFLAVVTSPAKVGAANASATANASVEITAFMTFLVGAGFKPERNALFTHDVAGPGGVIPVRKRAKHACGSSRRLHNPPELARLGDGHC